MYDIIFISYHEPNAENNWKRLKLKFNLAKRVKNITGIHQSHISAAKKSITNMFWVVDGDAYILDNFNFDYKVDDGLTDCIHVWHSRNPINKLEYGYGAVKLLPKRLTENVNINTVDMTTSISDKFKSVPVVSNITLFNTDPFNTWKSAFRECVKLSSRTINRQNDKETSNRLEIWCTVGIDQPFGEYAISGANEGREFGLKYSNNKDMLIKINDWNWLTDKFNSNFNKV
jgi:hypothetical protein